MANDVIGQILGRVLGGASQQPSAGVQQQAGPAGAQAPAGLGGVLGTMLGSAPGMPAGDHASFVARLLPLAIEWVQRNGGIGAALDRFRQQGYGAQANSWVAPGPNQPVGAKEVGDVVGPDELSRMSRQLGTGQEQVASGLAEVLPRLVDHMTPNGQLPSNADDVLGRGRALLDQALGAAQPH